MVSLADGTENRKKKTHFWHEQRKNVWKWIHKYHLMVISQNKKMKQTFSGMDFEWRQIFCPRKSHFPQFLAYGKIALIITTSKWTSFFLYEEYFIVAIWGCSTEMGIDNIMDIAGGFSLITNLWFPSTNKHLYIQQIICSRRRNCQKKMQSYWRRNRFIHTVIVACIIHLLVKCFDIFYNNLEFMSIFLYWISALLAGYSKSYSLKLCECEWDSCFSHAWLLLL